MAKSASRDICKVTEAKMMRTRVTIYWRKCAWVTMRTIPERLPHLRHISLLKGSYRSLNFKAFSWRVQLLHSKEKFSIYIKFTYTCFSEKIWKEKKMRNVTINRLLKQYYYNLLIYLLSIFIFFHFLL